MGVPLCTLTLVTQSMVQASETLQYGLNLNNCCRELEESMKSVSGKRRGHDPPMSLFESRVVKAVTQWPRPVAPMDVPPTATTNDDNSKSSVESLQPSDDENSQLSVSNQLSEESSLDSHLNLQPSVESQLSDDSSQPSLESSQSPSLESVELPTSEIDSMQSSAVESESVQASTEDNKSVPLLNIEDSRPSVADSPSISVDERSQLPSEAASVSGGDTESTESDAHAEKADEQPTMTVYVGQNVSRVFKDGCYAVALYNRGV